MRRRLSILVLLLASVLAGTQAGLFEARSAEAVSGCWQICQGTCCNTCCQTSTGGTVCTNRHCP